MEPLTEIGQIASLYNKVMEGLESNTIARDEYRDIFDNVSDGLFLIDPTYRICPNYSAASERILGTRGLTGRNVKDLFSEMLAPDKARLFADFIELMFDPSHSERSIASMNPLTAAHFTVPAGNGREPRLLGCSFYRVYDGSKERVLHVMAVIRDDTRLAVLAKELRTLRAQAQTQAQGAVPAQGAAQPRS